MMRFGHLLSNGCSNSALALMLRLLIEKLSDVIYVIRHIQKCTSSAESVIPLQSDNLENWIFEVQDKLAIRSV